MREEEQVIKHLIIQNFQAHNHLEIDLGPKITTIVGPSDAGKSAVLRSIKWNMMNFPRGDGFIKDGEKVALVTVEGDNRRVTRARGGSENLYMLDDQEFKAFGNDVPEEIEQFLNVTELNFQGQHDPPFWFSETAGEVSRQLNQIVDLGMIDSSLRGIESILRKSRTEKEILEEKRGELKKRGESLKWTKKAHKGLTALEVLRDKLGTTMMEHTLLSGWIDNIEKNQRRIRESERRLEGAETVLELGSQWKETRESRRNLEQSLCDLSAVIERASQPDPDPLDYIEDLVGPLTETRTKKKRLSDTLFLIEEKETTICQLEQRLQKEEGKLKRELGNVCPLCGTKLKTK